MLKVAEFTKQVIKEITKVTWATRKETSVSMMLVVAMVIVTSLFFLVVDLGAYKLVQLLLNLGVN